MIPDSAASDEDPDIVRVVLEHVSAVVPGLSEAMVAMIEQQVRAEYGGLRVRIRKRGKYLTPAQREAAYKDAVSNMPTPAVLRKHKISLATLYRLAKKPPGEGG